jgi:hypothetical protein
MIFGCDWSFDGLLGFNGSEVFTSTVFGTQISFYLPIACVTSSEMIVEFDVIRQTEPTEEV